MSNEAVHPSISCFPPLYSSQFFQGWQSPKSEQVHRFLLRDILLWGFNYQWKYLLIRKEDFSFSPKLLFIWNFSLCSLIFSCLNSCLCASTTLPAALVLCWKLRGGSVACSAQNNSCTKFSSKDSFHHPISGHLLTHQVVGVVREAPYCQHICCRFFNLLLPLHLHLMQNVSNR